MKTILTATALSLVLATSAFAQGTSTPATPAQPAPAAKTEAPAVKPTEAPKASTPTAAPAPSATAPKAATPATQPAPAPTAPKADAGKGSGATGSSTGTSGDKKPEPAKTDAKPSEPVKK
jgi:translation initiation factor IF-2